MARLDREISPQSPSLANSTFPWAAVPVRLSVAGERRLEARTFLTDGYGLRQRLESVPGGCVRFSEVARLWQPSRLKGFVVTPNRGLPFLSAGQVFEDQPRVRKWIAKAMVKDAADREVELGWLLMSISGEVGRVTAVYDEHLGKVITHDLLRIEPKTERDLGWLYAYMRTATFFAVARSSQYGHMIKHLEPEHVSSMPILMSDASHRREIGEEALRALNLRRLSRDLQSRAHSLYAEQIHVAESPDALFHTKVLASELFTGRRRLDAQHHRSDVVDITAAIRAASTRGVMSLAEVSESISLGNRFKRHFTDNGGGTPYRSASELFDVNPPVTKRIFSGLLRDPDQYMLRSGWIIMACSGQTYGLLGRTLVTTSAHEGVFGSHDLIRIVPDQQKIRIGYLQTVLSHPALGRPLVIRNAYGTSIPHLDPIDIRETPVPRFAAEIEAEIADLAEEAVELSRQADAHETRATERAEDLVQSALMQARQ